MNNFFETLEPKSTRGRKAKLNVVIDCESLDLRVKMQDMLKVAVNWGVKIGDNHGNTFFERDYILSDIYNMPIRNILNSYYIAKLQEIEENEETTFLANFGEFYEGLRSIWKNHKDIFDLEFWSYNANFDYDAFLKSAEYFMNESMRDSEFEVFMEEKWFCIQNLAVNTILANDKYKLFALEHELTTEGGSYSTTAEDCYRFLIDNAEFEEDHTGLSDSRIEYEILLACKKVATSETPRERTAMAWRIVNPNTHKRGKKKYCEMGKGQIFWELANKCLPKGAENTSYIQKIEL